jgi:hypothetical protein
MLVVQETSLNVFKEIMQGDTIVTAKGIQYPWQIVELWTDEELEFIDIYHVEPSAIPSGKMPTGYSFARDGEGVVRQVLTVVDLPEVPVTPRQIRLALTQMGLRSAIESYVASQDVTVQDSWNYATEFYRSNPLVAGAAQALNKNDAELDALFVLARSL